MRLAERDLELLLVSETLDSSSLRLDDPTSFSEPIAIKGMVTPLQNNIHIELFGERVVNMKQLISKTMLRLGARVEYKGEKYKCVTAAYYSTHNVYTLELMR